MRPLVGINNAYQDKPELLFVIHDEPEDIMGGCAKAAHHRLAVNGWTFFEIFRDGRSGDKTQYDVQKMTMCFDNRAGVPVGCAVTFQAWGDLNAGCFVRNEYRRQRIGARLINDLLFMERRPIRIHDGVAGSKDFWKVMGANQHDYIAEVSAPIR